MDIAFWGGEKEKYGKAEKCEKELWRKKQAQRQKREAISDCLGDQFLLSFHLSPDVDQSQLKHNTPSLTL